MALAERIARSGLAPNAVALLTRLLLIVLLALVARPAAAQAPAELAQTPTGTVKEVAPRKQPPIQTPAEALAQDAAIYADHYDVPIDEAMRRLQAQEASVPTVRQLAEAFGTRLAGVYIEHHPAYRVVIRLTGTDPVPDQLIYAGGMNLPVHFETGAAATREEILAAIREHQDAIRAELPFALGMGVDVRTGTLAVMIATADAKRYGVDLLRTEIEVMAGVPARIQLIERQEVNASVYGGSRVVGSIPATGKRGACTTGFVVTDGTRTGIVTAAHCPDELSYREVDGTESPLRLIGKWGSGFQDVQVNVAAQQLLPMFHPDPHDPKLRPLTAMRSREDTRSGDFVCHSGTRSGYSCSEVAFVDYAPHPDVCGALCDPAWVQVVGPSCGKGDSGGPVFSGTTAFGIAKGVSRSRDSCAFYFYMSTDYLPPGWTLLREPVLPSPPAATAAAAVPDHRLQPKPQTP
jgi:hypothetical protein